ncbi:hypothetical protein [Lysobacter capsici]|uniref:hypothetical protein n=1 Tax=Lysobacter capsici TaxID=435897 RepID=UPI0006274832|nr:hypothetical protein [Lysobacter capsici]
MMPLIRSIVLLGSGLAHAPAWALQADTPNQASAAVQVQAEPALSGSDGKPFEMKVSVDTPKPINYGDEIAVSVWILPKTEIDLARVIIRPRGPMAYMYKATPAKTDVAVDCPIGASPGKSPNVSFVVVCRLPGRDAQSQQWFGNDAFLETKRVNLEVEIELRTAPGETMSYLGYTSADLASPKSHVVIGGFLGAILWAIFLALSPRTKLVGSTSATPEDESPMRAGENNDALPALAAAPVATPTWSGLWRQFWLNLPGWVSGGLCRMVSLCRHALLGGLTALVLIVVAKGTEGFAPPVSVRIQDFWGGLMVGLLCAPLAKWLRDKISATI